MPEIAANISMLFREFAMLDRFRAAGAAAEMALDI
jgi:hydroxypyruvate isomerase